MAANLKRFSGEQLLLLSIVAGEPVWDAVERELDHRARFGTPTSRSAASSGGRPVHRGVTVRQNEAGAFHRFPSMRLCPVGGHAA